MKHERAEELDEQQLEVGEELELESLRTAVVPPHLLLQAFVEAPEELDIEGQVGLDEDGVHGSIFHLPVAVGAELEDVLARAREAGLTILAADVKGEDLLEARRDGVLARPTAWLFGNEARGLPDEQLALADRVVTVPIYGHAESMNLATAASVCLYESAFAQRS